MNEGKKIPHQVPDQERKRTAYRQIMVLILVQSLKCIVPVPVINYVGRQA